MHQVSLYFTFIGLKIPPLFFFYLLLTPVSHSTLRQPEGLISVSLLSGLLCPGIPAPPSTSQLCLGLYFVFLRSFSQIPLEVASLHPPHLLRYCNVSRGRRSKSYIILFLILGLPPPFTFDRFHYFPGTLAPSLSWGGTIRPFVPFPIVS